MIFWSEADSKIAKYKVSVFTLVDKWIWMADEMMLQNLEVNVRSTPHSFGNSLENLESYTASNFFSQSCDCRSLSIVNLKSL